MQLYYVCVCVCNVVGMHAFLMFQHWVIAEPVSGRKNSFQV